MTAHAMKGDRERCLAAGMDGYLSKPVDPKALFSVVDESASDKDAHVVTPVAGELAFDIDELRRRTGGDETLIAEVVRLFLEDCPMRMEALRRAIHNENRTELHAAAHALKGAASYVSARRVVDGAAELERLGQDASLAHAAAVFERLEREVGRLMADLSK